MNEVVLPTCPKCDLVKGMKGLVPAPKGRVRTSVGHKYLEALQSKVNGDFSDTASSPSSFAESKQPGLDLLILGITSGTAMDDIDFALCRFTQEVPEAPLCLDIVQVISFGLPLKTRLLPNATVRLSCHALEDPNRYSFHAQRRCGSSKYDVSDGRRDGPHVRKRYTYICA